MPSVRRPKGTRGGQGQQFDNSHSATPKRRWSAERSLQADSHTTTASYVQPLLRLLVVLLLLRLRAAKPGRTAGGDWSQEKSDTLEDEKARGYLS